MTARWMLSMGTEFFRALTMASYSVGLPSGSPPPIRAATSMFLMSLAKSFPAWRRSRPSCAWSWPIWSGRSSRDPFVACRSSRSVVQVEQVCEAAGGAAGANPTHRGPALPGPFAPLLVVRAMSTGRERREVAQTRRGMARRRRSGALSQVRSVRCAQSGALSGPVAGNYSCRRRSPVSSGWNEVASRAPWRTATTRSSTAARDLDPVANRLHPRRTDEDRAHGSATDPGNLDIGLERVHLAAEGVAADHHVDPAERQLVGTAVQDRVRQHDHAGAGAEDRQPAADELAHGLDQPQRWASIEIVVDSPPGTISASSPAS